MIAYPTTRAWRAYGLFTGLTFLLLLNFLRIALLGWYGARYPESFSFIHEFVWEYVFLIMVISLWVLWANGGLASVAKRIKQKRFGGVLKDADQPRIKVLGATAWYRIVCLVCVTVIALFFMNWFSAKYMALLASVSEGLMHVAGYEQVAILSKEKFLELLYPENNINQICINGNGL